SHLAPPRARPRGGRGLAAPPMTGPVAGPARRLPAGGAIVAVVVALACVAMASPARALEPVRISLADGLHHVEIGVADAVTMWDPAAGRALFTLPGPRILRVVPSGAGLDVVGGRRVDLPRVRVEVRPGPLPLRPRHYIR